jgi:lipopolysaccharide transport system ATP-binding protein
MNQIAVRVEHLSKQYHKGVLGYSTIRERLDYRWAKLRNREDPNSKIGDSRATSEGMFYALNDVSFTVEKGDALGIIGNNGSGKSTLLKILSKITSPTSGTIETVGKVASLLEVGTGFHPEMTGRENVYLNGAILGMSQAEINRKFDTIVDFSGIGSFIDTPVKRYSSGMYVRLAFSVASHLDSDIVILDEVLAVGDAHFQRKCLEKMEQISQDNGRTVLFVSHSAASVKRLCNHCLWLDQGRTVAYGETDEIVNQYVGGGAGTEFRYQTVWTDEATAPQNKDIILRKVYLCNARGEATTGVGIDEDFMVAIEYETKSETSYAGFTCLVKDEYEGLIFSSLSNLEQSWYDKPMGKGRFRTFCVFPGNCFNNVTLSFGLSFFGRDYSDLVSINNPLRIALADSFAIRGDYQHGYGGPLRPKLTWHTEKAD